MDGEKIKKFVDLMSFSKSSLLFAKPYFTQILCPLTIFKSMCRKEDLFTI